MKIKTGIGQDSHRFTDKKDKKCVIGGLIFENCPALDGNSDADVVLHAICNALTGIHGVVVLGPITDSLCKNGISDSAEYVKQALSYLGNFTLTHVSISIEGKIPKFVNRLDEMRAHIAQLLQLNFDAVCITATTGEGLTDFGKGLGLQAFVIITAQSE